MFSENELPLLRDDAIELKLATILEADAEKGYVPAYFFLIYLADWDEPIGYIDLRIGDNENLFYGGQIGYRIHEEYRGFGYAGRACHLVVPVAKMHSFTMLRITCSPDNAASKRTIEKLGARLLGLYQVPAHHELYLRGETEKLVYEWYI